jgi:tRNA-specific 2-thiouridylase
VGLSFYTLGQRKGIGVGGTRSGSGEAWYVARKDLASNTLQIVQGHDHPWLLSHRLSATRAHWIAGQAPEIGRRLGGKTRYRQADSPCRVIEAGDGRFGLEFEEAQWAVTPGQSAVLYDGEVCLGGGLIDNF